ncbi:ZIP family metal transporter [Sphingomonas sp. ID1715]|uniref:ZIP family metal transporter n=1 Tax=Sphingomonas sp. ID1715 TaxID=1656898 RepID=UPI001489F386|nr:ZIP family metal transporter [Sphingomonas sp. ID1715]NNM77439.1 ZIP family metal transporter [Sphingomonas sp. ID1715]
MTSPVLTGILASLIAGAATGLGGLALWFTGKATAEQQKLMLGFAAGVMLAASFFSLIIPGIEQAQHLGASRWAAAATVVAAVLFGAFTLSSLHRHLPVDHLKLLGTPGVDPFDLKRIGLFVVAITLHNFPEGMAVGVSFGTGDFGAGLTTATGIGVQNIPEGLAVAVAVLTLGHSRRTAFLIALATGLVEPVGGVFGAGLAAVSAALLPWGLGFAAGAMIYVVATEIIPDTQRPQPSARASHGLMIGLAAMMFLDVTLG